MSKFADNLVDLAEKTAEYIRMLEKDVERLNKIKVNLSQRSLENTKEIAELQAENSELKANLKRCVSAMLDSQEEVQQYRKDIDFLLSKRNQGE